MLLQRVSHRALIIGALFACNSNARAQDALPAAGAPAEGHLRSNGTEQAAPEIMVTARRRNERQIDVPATITSLGKEALQRYATTDLSSVGVQIPQVIISRAVSGTGAAISIRGIATNIGSDDGFEQSVSINIDGVPTARGRIIQTGLLDVAQVQVLKGPQALYFGKNSPAGVIVVDSNGPTASFEGRAQAGYETTAREYFSEVALGGPITDTLGFRVALRGSDMTGGYVRNRAEPIATADDPIAYDRNNGLSIPGRAFKWGPGTKQIAGRITLEWKPDPQFSAKFKFFASDYRDQGDGAQLVPISCPVGQTQVKITDLSAVLFGAAPGLVADPNSFCGRTRSNTIGELPDSIRNALPLNGRDTEFAKNRNYLSSLTLNYDLGAVNLTSVTGFYKFTNFDNTFFNASSLSLAGGGLNSYNTQWTEELRASAKLSDNLHLNGGFIYGHEKHRYNTFSSIVRNIDPASGTAASVIADQHTTAESFSGYGELVWKLAPTVELSGGARYTHEKRDGTAVNEFVSPVARALNLALAQGTVVRGRLRNDNVSPQATLLWHPTKDSTVYVGYRTGFKSGTISNPQLISPAFNSRTAVLQPEKVRGYEAGLKFESSDRTLRGDIAIYHYNYKDLQVAAFDNVANTVVTRNAAGAQIDGVEGSVEYRVTPELNLHGSAGYNRARYSTFTNAGCYGGQTAAQGCVARVQNLTGETLPRAPLWSISAGSSWEREVSAHLGAGLSVDAHYTSRYRLLSNNNPFGTQSGYATVDLAARVFSVDKRWELSVVGKNIFNQYYISVATENPLGQTPGSIVGVPGLPRTILLQGTVNF